MKIGDTVKYLNEVGGGTITKFQSRNVIVVLQDDGFEVPVLKTECIVVGESSSSTTQQKQNTPKEQSYTPSVETVAESDEQLILALVSQDKTELTSSLDVYLINLTNNFHLFTLVEETKDKVSLIESGEVEPNTKMHIDSIAISEIGNTLQYKFQSISYKKGNFYKPKPIIDKSIAIKSIKLAQSNNFRKTNYFHETCYIIQLLEDNTQTVVNDLKAKFSSENDEKPTPTPRKKKNNSVLNKGILEVDLHIHELLDDTTGMSNTDMLKHQIDVLKSHLSEYKDKKGQKIVFIHGKGNGTLKTEVTKILKRTPKIDYYDASFQQYGFGATMVVIR